MAYYNELQQIPGFEVVPVGVAKKMLFRWQRSAGRPLLGSGEESLGSKGTDISEGASVQTLIEPLTGGDFQRLAQFMHVDAVVVGSVTEYDPYYPPRFGLSVRSVRSESRFPPDSARLRPALGDISGVEDTRVVRLGCGVCTGAGAIETQTPCVSGDMPAEPHLAASADSLPAVLQPAEISAWKLQGICCLIGLIHGDSYHRHRSRCVRRVCRSKTGAQPHSAVSRQRR